MTAKFIYGVLVRPADDDSDKVSILRIALDEATSQTIHLTELAEELSFEYIGVGELDPTT